MAQRPLIDILLPTWNGAAFLPAQLDSLLRQQDVSTRILLRDDGAEDGTCVIVRRFAERHGQLLPHAGPRLGVVGNVDALLSRSEAEDAAGYFALCDQDDIWYPHKLAVSLQAMRALEKRFGPEKPLLVCGDARCVTADGRPLHASFLKRMGLPPDWGDDLRHVLVMSHALGCTCLGNAALRRLALPLPEAEAIFMHDWWLLLVAVSFGAVHCLDMPLLEYRQHAANVLGATRRGRPRQRLAAWRDGARRTQRQARTFLERYAGQLDPAQRQIVQAWAFMPERPWLLRRWRCWRQGFAKPGLARLWT